MFELLRETFRQNPDYVIVGEVRGNETFVLFQGMASGHPCYSTFHAGSIEGLVKRLQTPPINLPASLIECMDAVCMVTHIKDPKRNIRRLVGIKEIKSVKQQAGVVDANDIVVWDAFNDEFIFSKNSYIFEKMSKKIGKSIDKIYREITLRTALFKKIAAGKNIEYRTFSNVMNKYYKNSAEVLREYGIVE